MRHSGCARCIAATCSPQLARDSPGATRISGCISQSISCASTASVPVRHTKAMNTLSFSPTQLCRLNQMRRPPPLCGAATRAGFGWLAVIAGRSERPGRLYVDPARLAGEMAAAAVEAADRVAPVEQVLDVGLEFPVAPPRLPAQVEPGVGLDRLRIEADPLAHVFGTQRQRRGDGDEVVARPQAELVPRRIDETVADRVYDAIGAGVDHPRVVVAVMGAEHPVPGEIDQQVDVEPFAAYQAERSELVDAVDDVAVALQDVAALDPVQRGVEVDPPIAERGLGAQLPLLAFLRVERPADRGLLVAGPLRHEAGGIAAVEVDRISGAVGAADAPGQVVAVDDGSIHAVAVLEPVPAQAGQQLPALADRDLVLHVEAIAVAAGVVGPPGVLVEVVVGAAAEAVDRIEQIDPGHVIHRRR